jgi:hypothetical protein
VKLEPTWHLDSNLENQENGGMKTTLELPDALVKQVKLRALEDGRKLKETVADLLRKGLAAKIESADTPFEPTVTTDRKTGLPRIEGGHPANPANEMTPDRVAAILEAQELGWHHAAGR